MKKNKDLAVLTAVGMLVGMCGSLTGCENAETGTVREVSSEKSESNAEETAEQTAEENSLIPDDATWLNGNAYYAYAEALSWEDAESYCNDLGGHLISINSADEQSLALELAQNTGKDNAWTGGYLSADDVWTWTDGSSFSYTNWDASQPDCYDGTEFYIRFPSRDISYTETNWIAYEGKWNDTAMEGDSDAPLSSFCFICEWQDGVADENADVEISEHETEASADDLIGECVGVIAEDEDETYRSTNFVDFFYYAPYLGDKTISSYTIYFEMYSDYSYTPAYAYGDFYKFSITVNNTVESGEYITAVMYSHYTNIAMMNSNCTVMFVTAIDMEFSDGTSTTVENGGMVVAIDGYMSSYINTLEKHYPEQYNSIKNLIDNDLQDMKIVG